MHMFFDIVGACNLKCPSCPMGNSENPNSKKATTLELFTNVVKKAAAEGITSLHLYNWTEPLIHPKVGEFISIVEAAGIACGISSNLNIAKNMAVAIAANPTFFRISLSGFYQETYQRGHEGGDIEVVKTNMIELSRLIAQLKVKTNVEVYYHRYLDNTDEELLMKDFAEKLGFTFSTGYSLMMPLEKALDIVERPERISEADKAVLKRIALPPSDATIKASREFGRMSCSLKDGMVVLDCQANVVLCCTLFSQLEHSVGNYLDHSLAVLQKQKNTQPKCKSMCDRCMSHDAHIYAMHPNEGALAELAINRIMTHRYRQLLNLPEDAEAKEAEDFGAHLFDEESYLDSNMDIRIAIMQGTFINGFDHYIKYGQHENRPGVRLR